MAITNKNHKDLLREYQFYLKRLKYTKNDHERFFLLSKINNLNGIINSMKMIPVIIPKKVNSSSNIDFYYKYIEKRTKEFDKKFIENKDLFYEKFKKILVEIETVLSKISGLTDESILISERDFIIILHDFFKSINLENFFNRVMEERKIYNVKDKKQKNTSGETLYNFYKKDCDIFVYNFTTDIFSMRTLVHEMGHVFDHNGLNDINLKDYNYYLVNSIYLEVLSLTFERLLFRYLIKNNIFPSSSKSELYASFIFSHDYFVEMIIFTLMNSDILINQKYNDLSLEEIMKNMSEDKFLNKANIKYFLEKMNALNMYNTMKYSFGSIISPILASIIENEGLNNKLMNEVSNERNKLFDIEFFERNNINENTFLKEFNKELELIKR